MPPSKNEKRTWLFWFGPLFAFLYAPVSVALSDMVLICSHSGSGAYFDQGLRIAKHRPYTLSTGIILSDNLATLGWLIGALLWVGLITASMFLVSYVAAKLKRVRQHAAATQ